MTERSIAAKTRTRQSTLTNQPKMARRPALLLAALTHRSSTAKAAAIAAFVVQLSLPAAAQDGPTRPAPASASATRPPPTGADFARLEAQVNEQRQLIIQLMQNEQQRYDMLLKLIGSASGTLPPPGDTPADVSGGPHGGSGTADGSSAMGVGKAGKGPTPAIPQHKVAALEGKVSVSSGDLSEVYV